jgi:hypothetical protein
MKFKTVFFAIVAAIALIHPAALAGAADIGSGTHATQEEIDYWRLINGGKTIAPKSRGSGR